MKQIFAICTILFLGIMLGAAIAAPTELPMLPTVATVTAGLFIAGFQTKVEGVAGSAFVNLTKASRNNMGGLKVKLYFGKYDDVATWPTLPDQESQSVTIETLATLTGDITFNTGKCMFEMYGTPGEIELKNTLIGDTDAQSFKQEVSVKHPGLAAKLIGFCAATNNENLVLIVERHNGTKYMVGFEGMPATKASDESGSGKKVEDGAAATIGFVSYGPTPAPIYTGSIPLTPAGSGSGV